MEFTKVIEEQGFQFTLFDMSLLKLVQKNKNEALIAEKRNLMKNLRTLDPPRVQRTPMYDEWGEQIGFSETPLPRKMVQMTHIETRLFIVICERTITDPRYMGDEDKRRFTTEQGVAYPVPVDIEFSEAKITINKRCCGVGVTTDTREGDKTACGGKVKLHDEPIDFAPDMQILLEYEDGCGTMDLTELSEEEDGAGRAQIDWGRLTALDPVTEDIVSMRVIAVIPYDATSAALLENSGSAGFVRAHRSKATERYYHDAIEPYAQLKVWHAEENDGEVDFRGVRSCRYIEEVAHGFFRLLI